MLLMYVQSGCKSAIMLSILLAPKLTPNFQGLYVGKEYRGWSGGPGRVLLFVCYIALVPASSVYQMKIYSTSAIQKKKKKKKKKKERNPVY